MPKSKESPRRTGNPLRTLVIVALVFLAAGLYGPTIARRVGSTLSAWRTAATYQVTLGMDKAATWAEVLSARFAAQSETPTKMSSAPVEDQAVAVGGESQQVASANAEGFVGPTTAEAKQALGLDVQRLRTEASAFVWRSVPNAVSATCPNGWVCTLHLASGEIKVFAGDGTKYQIVAGTFRNVLSKAYPSGDAVYGVPPCELLSKEQSFGASEVPSFSVSAGNFTCFAAETEDDTDAVVTTCPTTPAEAAKLLGGNASNWSTQEDWNGDGWKYGPGAPGVTVTSPEFGRVDYALGALKDGQSASGVTEATFWCLGE